MSRSTSTGVPGGPDEVPEVEDEFRPPPPRPRELVSAGFWGGMVFAFTAVFSATIVLWTRTPFPSPRDHGGFGVAAAFTGSIVAMALWLWWRALTRKEEGGTRWSGLLGPFFIVVGAAAGVPLANLIPVPVTSSGLSYCYIEVTDRDSRRYDACTAAAERCASELPQDEGYDALVACIQRGMAAR